MMGVMIHVLGDCANNIGVVIAATVIWLANYGGRFYADPAVSMGIAIMIFVSSIPLSMDLPHKCQKHKLTFLPAVKQSGLILLQSAPQGVDHDNVKEDLESVCLLLPHQYDIRPYANLHRSPVSSPSTNSISGA